ncbi:MAG TPA: response regulator transcription factor [Blastocatellia bacterium]
MSREIRIVMADDHPVVREGLARVIESDPQLKIIAQAGDGQSALEQIKSLHPDVAVLDIDMPVMDGFSVAREIQKLALEIEVVFLTIHREEELFEAALNLGAKGYVLKDSAVNDIIESIRAVASHQHYISPQLSSYLVRRKAKADALTRQKPSLEDLTPTERRILRLIAEDRTTREIADQLFISPRTVDTHRANICRKLDLHGSLALVRFAIEHKSEL